MKELGQKLDKANSSKKGISPKIALAKYLADAKIFQKLTVPLAKEPLYFNNFFDLKKNDSFLFQDLAKLLEHQHGYIDLHNIPKIFGLSNFWPNSFTTAIFGLILAKK